MKNDVVGRVSLLLADLLTRATPGDIAALRRAAERVPAAAALFDQLDAARADAETLAPHTVGDAEMQAGDVPINGIPGWLLIAMVDTLTRYSLGRSAVCVHNPHPSRPQPVVAAAWKPGLVACVSCAYRHFHLPPSRPEAFRCDACGHEGEIHAGRLVFGALLFLFGTCDNCFADMPAHSTGGNGGR